MAAILCKVKMQYPRNRRNREAATTLSTFPSCTPFRFLFWGCSGSLIHVSGKCMMREYGALLMGGNDYEWRKNRLIPFSSPAHVSSSTASSEFHSLSRKGKSGSGNDLSIYNLLEERPSSGARSMFSWEAGEKAKFSSVFTFCLSLQRMQELAFCPKVLSFLPHTWVHTHRGRDSV